MPQSHKTQIDLVDSLPDSTCFQFLPNFRRGTLCVSIKTKRKMCKCLSGNVACCCFSCALSILVSFISAFFVVLVIVGLVVYFVYYHEQEDDVSKIKNDLQDGFKNTYDKIKNGLSQ